MTRRTILLIFGLLNSLTIVGQRHDNLRPLFDETTELGTQYLTYYEKLTAGLSKDPHCRTFSMTLFPELTSIEATGKRSYVLIYRGFKNQVIEKQNENIVIRKSKGIAKSERSIDTSMVMTLQYLFQKVIFNANNGDPDIIITHPTYYYFYTWMYGQGIISVKSEEGLFLQRTERLINLHKKLIEYAKTDNSGNDIRLMIINEAEALIKEYD